MPFDSTPCVKTNLDLLIEALKRTSEYMWYFGDCSSCAIETAHLTLDTPHIEQMQTPRDRAAFVELASHLEMCVEDAEAIFMPGRPTSGEWHDVKPHHVAAALEHYQDKGEALSPFEFVNKEK